MHDLPNVSKNYNGYLPKVIKMALVGSSNLTKVRKMTYVARDLIIVMVIVTRCFVLILS